MSTGALEASGTVGASAASTELEMRAALTQWLRSLVTDRTIGTITLARIRHGHFYGLQQDFKSRWYVDPAKSGGGALLDEGVHGADLLAWLFGVPDSVTATVSAAALKLLVEDLGVATFHWNDGLVAELASSFTSIFVPNG